MIARVLMYCTRLFCLWHCVGVIEYYYGGAQNKLNIVIFYLFENRFGERKIEIEASGYNFPSYDSNEKKQKTIKGLNFYRSRILPWLWGRNDREVPTFKNRNCNKREFLKQLKEVGQNIVVKNDK